MLAKMFHSVLYGNAKGKLFAFRHFMTIELSIVDNYNYNYCRYGLIIVPL